ncbi:MAG: shikimate kinase [Candidatus Zixiibacteriota bacterium]|jgi:shikimate kinase
MNLQSAIFLIGFSGSGKTSIGKELARRFKVRFYDTDAMIEKDQKRKIGEIFERDGERFFRRIESEVIRDVIAARPTGKVVSLGGGAFESRANRNLVNSTGVSIYLSCSVREIYRRLSQKTDRPLLRVKPEANQTMRQAQLARIKELLRERIQNYSQAILRYATTGKDIETAVSDLYTKIEEYHGRHRS